MGDSRGILARGKEKKNKVKWPIEGGFVNHNVPKGWFALPSSLAPA